MPSRETQNLSFFYKEPRYSIRGVSSSFIGTVQSLNSRLVKKIDSSLHLASPSGMCTGVQPVHNSPSKQRIVDDGGVAVAAFVVFNPVIVDDGGVVIY